MALPPDYVAGLKIYGIAVDDDGLRLSSSDKNSGGAMDALFKAASKHEGMIQMARLHKIGS